MFTESLCDSRLDHPSRRWTTLVSFGLQALAVSALLTLPFLSTQSLPQLSFAAHLMVPISQVAMPTQSAQAEPNSGAVAGHYVFVAPDHISRGLPNPDEGAVAPPNLPFGQSSSSDNAFPLGVPGATGNASVPLLAAAPVAHPPRVSVMMEGNLIHRVQPQYPPIAIQTRTQGSVVLRAVISREGNIENLQLLSGHPMLVKAAMDAVRQWHYQPYFLNHEAVEVETQITVNFVLGDR